MGENVAKTLAITRDTKFEWVLIALAYFAWITKVDNKNFDPYIFVDITA